MSGIAVIFVVVASSAEATGSAYTFSVTGGCADTCAAYASITPGNGTLTVTLTDTQANPISAGDLLSGIQITTSVSSTSASLASQTGSLINVNGGGSTTAIAGNPTHWGASGSGTSIVLATAGGPAQGGQPIDLIIGPPGPGGVYTNANGSIAGNHNPYITGPGTFVLVDSAILPSTAITSVSFRFGTMAESILVGRNMPEPTSLALLAASLAGLALPTALRRRRRHVAGPE